MRAADHAKATVGPDDIDGDMAQRFLDVLGADRCTFQTFDDKGENQALARILHGSFEQHIEELVCLNADGAGVFTSINQTDGEGRSKANVRRVRSLMLDLDGAPLDPVRECALKPHVIVETSPARFQCLWRVSRCFPLDKFEAAQLGLAKRFDGDTAVATLERCCRLPGFFHNKQEPFRSCSTNGARLKHLCHARHRP